MNKQPNVLIVMGDQWRRSSVGCMGQDPVLTPNMDRLAQAGTLCTRAYSCSPLCTPARAAFLTGRHPWPLDMMYNWQRVPVLEPNLATAFGAAGYDTALIGKWHLDDHELDDVAGDEWNTMTPPGPRRVGFRFWYSAGCVHDHWHRWYMDTEGRVIDERGWQVDHETEVAVDYIRNRRAERPADRPWMMWLNWSPPHNGHPGPHHAVDDPRTLDKHQYYAPEEDEAIYRRPGLEMWHPDTDAEAYQRQAPGHFGCITSMDRNLGLLLRCLEEEGLAENTVVLLTADHGEMLGTHDLWMKDIWYEQSIGVPLIVRFPGRIPASVRNDCIINTPDILPTLCGLADVATPAGRDGVDLSATLCGSDGPRPDAAFLAFCTGAPPPEKTRYDFPIEKGMYWRGLRTARYTYACVDQRPESIFSRPERRYPFPKHATWVLFDNERDPWQTQPIYAGQGCDDVAAELHAKLAAWLDSLDDPFLTEYWSAEPGGIGA
jgi:arylsulfatase A-like enzyme